MTINSKILIFSDIHCHPHQKDYKKLENCLEVINWVFKEAKKRNIQDIVFGGDLFHDRQKIDILTYYKVYDTIYKNMNSGEFYFHILLGNHDIWKYENTEINSVYPLSSIKGINVIGTPTTTKLKNGYEISWLPYTHDPEKDLLLIKNNNRRKVLVGHVALNGAVWNAFGSLADVHVEHDGEMKKVEANIFDSWDNVFLGHYHAEQKMNNIVEYIGSPLQLSWGEQNQKKYIIEFDMETGEKEYIKNYFSPVHLKIDLKDLSYYDDNVLFNNYIEIKTSSEDNTEIINTRDILEKKGVGSIKFNIVEKDIDDQIKDIEDAKSILNKKNNIIEEYVEKTEINDLEKSKLIAIGNQIISECLN
jgi:DNA repair exonuclease SbcCD nuclease subunit